MSIQTQPHSLHVVIAGGGVAALEAMIALHALAGDRVRITLLSPEHDFRYRPMAVAEPFTIAHARHIALARVAGDFDADLVVDALVAVEPDERRVLTRGAQPIGYDALVIACGTRQRPAFGGAITLDDRTLGATLRGLVQDVEEGYTQHVAFVAPAQAFWPLPLYELALLTAQRAYDMNVTVDISVISPESAPLTLFGAGISDELSRLLHNAGIAFHGSSFADLTDAELTLQPSGLHLRPDRVVALPLLEGPLITGVPTDPHNFIAIDELGAVRGLDNVYAAGDATTHPIKHGSVAAQQADTIAQTIAAHIGADVDPRPLRPVIHAMLLTGHQPRYLQAKLDDDATYTSTVSDTCPWQPPTKIAAHHLGPYLAGGERLPVRA